VRDRPGRAAANAERTARLRWRDRLFRRAREQQFQRRTSDWLRLVAGVIVLVAAARHSGDVTPSERAVYDLFASVPDQLNAVFIALYRLGALWAVGLVVAAALVGRRVRLGRDLLVAGALAWVSARLVGELVVAHENFGRSFRLATGLEGAPQFPAVRVAVVVAVIAAAAPYVTRPTRIVGRGLVLVLALAAMALGRAYPNDIFAAVVLGWTVAAAVHLLFGSPGGRPTEEQVRKALVQLGVDVHSVELASLQPTGWTLFFADTADGIARVKAIGRDQADSRFLAKLWRFVVYRDSGPPLTFTRLHQLEREAYLMLLAREAGVRVPKVIVVGSAGSGSACLAVERVGAVALGELTPEVITDDVLEEIWANVVALHRARVVHGRLDSEHVAVSHEGAWIVDFDDARATASEERRARDHAELLVTTASLVGVDRAVAAALRTLDRADFVAALPLLQSAALTRTTRRDVSAHELRLTDLLQSLRVAAASELGVEPPEPTELRRMQPTNAALAIGALVATVVLLNDVGDPGELWATFRHADWSWIAIALVASLASNVGYAIGLMGTVPSRLPLWPTTEVQIAMSFSNLAVPAIGGQGLQVRYLQKTGSDLGTAIAAGGVLSTVGNLIASLGLFVLAVVIGPTHADFSLLPASGLLELTVAVVVFVLVVSAVVLSVPKLRRVTVPPVRRATASVATVLRSPTKLALLVGGNVVAVLLSTACLAACLEAFGDSTSFVSLMAANIAVMAVASTIPIPGGGAAVGTVGLSAVLVSFGVANNVAVAGALANQLVFYYLPAIPGWFATKHLLSHDYL
jgi:glycosyltransferase 2 family protein